MAARKYTDTELEAMEAKERDGLLDGNQKRALTAWKKRRAKASEKPVETPEAMSDAPTQSERADAALEAALGKLDATDGADDSTPALTVAEPTPRTAIVEALTSVYGAVSALQKLAFQTNDKVIYEFSRKLLDGELMDIKANYSKDAK